MEQQPERDNGSESSKLVAQLNMPPEDEPEDAGDWETPPPAPLDVAAEPPAPVERAWPAQALPLGLLALAVIVISMFLILQGVFEMIPD